MQQSHSSTNKLQCRQIWEKVFHMYNFEGGWTPNGARYRWVGGVGGMLVAELLLLWDELQLAVGAAHDRPDAQIVVRGVDPLEVV